MATSKDDLIKYFGSMIGGQFVLPAETSGSWQLQNPSAPSTAGLKISYSFSLVPEVTKIAKNAQRDWEKIEISTRVQLLVRWQKILLDTRRDLVWALGFETGKTVWDSEIEFDRSIKIIQGFCQDAIKNQEILTPKRPLGVIAIVTPATEALESILGFSAAAILAGNSVVLKPSEKTVLVSQMIAQSIQAAGFPDGIWNLIQGERELGRRLCVHEDVDGILFAGSYDVSIRIKQDTLQQHWKKLILFTGGKNAAIIWDDAALEGSVQSTVEAGFSFCGQSAFSVSRVIVHKKLFPTYLEKLHDESKKFKIGPVDTGPFMGPMINHASVDRYMKFLGVAVREGAELVMRGKALELGKEGGFFVAPSIAVSRNSSIEAAKKAIYQQSEMSSPLITLIETDDLDHAAALANATQFGLCTSVFSQNAKTVQKFSELLDCGLVVCNQSPTRRSGLDCYVPVKKSGNHRRAGTGLLEECLWDQALV